MSVIILNVNGLNSPVKRYRMSDKKEKEKDKSKNHLYAADKRLTSEVRTCRLNMQGWRKLSHLNGNKKKAVVAILILDK